MIDYTNTSKRKSKMAGGKIWTIEEMEELERLLNEGLTPTEIGSNLKLEGRTKIAIAHKARHIAVMTKAEEIDDIAIKQKIRKARLKHSLKLGQKVIGVRYVHVKHTLKLKGTIVGIYKHHVRLKLDRHKYTECFRYQDIRGIN